MVVGVNIMPHLLAAIALCVRIGSSRRLELYECGACDVDVLRRLARRFDVVVFIGVLYHLKRTALRARDRSASIACGVGHGAFQSVVRGPAGERRRRRTTGIPSMKCGAFGDQPRLARSSISSKEDFNGDESDWWFATREVASRR